MLGVYYQFYVRVYLRFIKDKKWKRVTCATYENRWTKESRLSAYTRFSARVVHRAIGTKHTLRRFRSMYFSKRNFRTACSCFFEFSNGELFL